MDVNHHDTKYLNMVPYTENCNCDATVTLKENKRFLYQLQEKEVKHPDFWEWWEELKHVLVYEGLEDE